MPKVGYNSHGSVASLAEIKELEVTERENDWFNDQKLDLNKTRAIWVTHKAKYALRYVFSASLHDFPERKPNEIDESEWKEWKKALRNPKQHVCTVNIREAIKVLDDEDEGWLYIWPVYKTDDFARNAAKLRSPQHLTPNLANPTNLKAERGKRNT
jgi:hypothetical protein